MKKHLITNGIKHGPTVSIQKAATAHWSIASKIHKQFPKVSTVADSLQAIRVDVTSPDRQSAEPQEHTKCAFARAACRAFKSDGAYIGISTSYLVFGKTAIRFQTPQTVAREITTFDRHEDFATGIYRLSPVCPSHRLGVPGSVKRKHRKKKGKNKNNGHLIKHLTTRIRSEESVAEAA